MSERFSIEPGCYWLRGLNDASEEGAIVLVTEMDGEKVIGFLIARAGRIVRIPRKGNDLTITTKDIGDDVDPKILVRRLIGVCERATSR